MLAQACVQPLLQSRKLLRNTHSWTKLHTICVSWRICHCLLFHEHGKQNFVQPLLQSRKLLRNTHAWTKLHNEVMS